MPAVQLIRLRAEIASLIQLFNQPAEFYRQLYELLDTYSNRVYRSGLSVSNNKQVERFHVPPIVLNQLEAELVQLSRLDRFSSLAIVDQMGNAPYWEIRYLACCILGQIDPNPPDDILRRINAWLTPELDPNLQEMLLSKAIINVGSAFPRVWQEVIKDWMENPQQGYKTMALLALYWLAKDPTFINLPFIYTQIRSPIMDAVHQQRPILLNIIKVLIERSPIESAFFLKQIISTASLSARAVRLIRKILIYLPKESQENLKELMKDIPTSGNESE